MVEHIKLRTKAVGIRCIHLCSEIKESQVGKTISNQLLRSSTSIGANYRSAARAKSTADYINKLKIVEEEADETVYWLELLEECGLIERGKTYELRKELNEIISIIVATIKKLRAKI
ncbi:MAG: four helix bundle protein [Bacteroidota bacterium]